jgi:predicted nucleic acid-binding protein
VRLTFDSNILIYTLSRADPRHAAAASLLARATRADCVLTLQSLAESFRVITTKLRFDPREAKREVDGFRFAFPVCAAGEADLGHAMRAVDDHHLSFWDAMLWATARRAGCRLLLSEDFQDGRDLLNPFDPANRRSVDLALPEVGHNLHFHNVFCARATCMVAAMTKLALQRRRLLDATAELLSSSRARRAPGTARLAGELMGNR